MTQQQKPNFIIIGAMKAATTSLYTYLKQHPDVFMTTIKEPKFFNNLKKNSGLKMEGKMLKKITTFKQYYSLFKHVKNENAIGEASPSYIFDEKCSTLIKKNLPETKIIAVIRQPVARAFSNFLHARRADKEKKSDFETAFKDKDSKHFYKEKGYYTKQLERYFTLFPKENIKVLLFEDLIKNPIKTTQEVFKFLNIDNSFIPDTSKKANVSGTPKGIFGWLIMKLRHYNLIPNIQFSNYLPGLIIQFIFNSAYKKASPLAPELKKRLTHTYYKEDILKLEKLIGKNLQHWLI